MATHVFELDLGKQPPGVPAGTMVVRQGDSGEVLVATLTRGGQAADLSGCTVELMAVRPDRAYCTQAMTPSGPMASCTVDASFFGVPGLMRTLYVRVSGPSGTETTPDILATVLPEADVSGVEAAEYRRVLDTLIGEIKAAKTEASAAADEAETRANKASESATAASASARDAKSSADAAEGSARAAEGSATKASGSAGEAKSAAASAKKDASTASTAASDAQGSKVAAAQSAENLRTLDEQYRSSEAARVEAEDLRATAEMERKKAEEAREAEAVKSASAVTLDAGAEATAAKEGAVLKLGIPRGAVPVISLEATVDDTTGTPQVEVTRGGTDERPEFGLSFSGLKAVGWAQPMPEFDASTGRYTNESIKALCLVKC